MNRLAELYPASKFTGLDISQKAIEFARAEALAKDLNNIEFGVADLSDFDEMAES